MLHVAFLGVAHIHTPGFLGMLARRPEFKIKYIHDHLRQRAAIRATETGATVATVEQVLADPSITAVIICSETNLHEPLVLAAAKAKKHLFVEKPLGMASIDAYRMAAAIDSAGVLFQTGYFRRSDPKIQFLQSHIAQGNFGQITRIRGSNCHTGSLGGWFDDNPDISTNWRWMADPAQAGCGAFGDLGTHVLDLMLLLAGDVTSATAQIDPVTARYPNPGQPATDETGEGLLRFKSGTIGTLAAGWVDHADPLSLLISGTEAHAAIIDDKLYLTSKKAPTFDGSAPVRKSEMPPALPHAFELFLDALEGKPAPLVKAREAAYRNAVMQAMYEAATTQTWVSPKKA
jgi:predicted dehydrogenase